MSFDMEWRIWITWGIILCSANFEYSLKKKHGQKVNENNSSIKI